MENKCVKAFITIFRLSMSKLLRLCFSNEHIWMNNPLEKISKIATSIATFSKLTLLSFSEKVFTNLNSLGFSQSPSSTRFPTSCVDISLFWGKHWPKSVNTTFTRQPRHSQAAENFDKSAKNAPPQSLGSRLKKTRRQRVQEHQKFAYLIIKSSFACFAREFVIFCTFHCRGMQTKLSPEMCPQSFGTFEKPASGLNGIVGFHSVVQIIPWPSGKDHDLLLSCI